jgi:carboxyl-terminal processing protease
MQLPAPKRLLSALATAALAVTMLGAVPTAAPPLDRLLAADVSESYRLLSQTYYRAIDEQALLDGARAGMLQAAKGHPHVPVPEMQPADTPEDTVAMLDRNIANAAAAAHLPQSTFAYAAIGGMAQATGDKYTTFFTPKELVEFREALDPEKISGIGVLIGTDPSTGFITLSYVVPGTPAERAGLEPGDLIEAIDGTSTKGMTTDGASKLLRGKAGVAVQLSVAEGDAQPREIDITRSEIKPPTVVYKMLPGGIGYVYVMAFGQETPEEFDVALDRLREQNARAIVLDLRNDGGGYVDSAIKIASRFISHKALLIVEQRGEPDDTVPAENLVPMSVPVTVLVNGYTASASEITAGALQDDGVATLVGTKTFGKGVMQTLTELADGAGIKITTAHYLTPSHRDINLKGIEPDVKIDQAHDARFGDLAHDPQLRAALQLLQHKIAEAPATTSSR